MPFPRMVSCEDCHHMALQHFEWPCKVCRGDHAPDKLRDKADTMRTHFIRGHNPLRAAVQALEKDDEQA